LERGDIVSISSPRADRLVRWHRAGFRHYWRWKSRCLGGRPQIGAELRALIRRMSIENPLWGAPRIHGVTISTHIFDRRHVMGQFRGIRPLAPVRLATKRDRAAVPTRN
jgi:hypothetical protein